MASRTFCDIDVRIIEPPKFIIRAKNQPAKNNRARQNRCISIQFRRAMVWIPSVRKSSVNSASGSLGWTRYVPSSSQHAVPEPSESPKRTHGLNSAKKRKRKSLVQSKRGKQTTLLKYFPSDSV